MILLSEFCRFSLFSLFLSFLLFLILNRILPPVCLDWHCLNCWRLFDISESLAIGGFILPRIPCSPWSSWLWFRILKCITILSAFFNLYSITRSAFIILSRLIMAFIRSLISLSVSGRGWYRSAISTRRSLMFIFLLIIPIWRRSGGCRSSAVHFKLLNLFKMS